jgi:DsbC/DsbD-like thiol-disulfide interchange protein
LWARFASVLPRLFPMAKVRMVMLSNCKEQRLAMILKKTLALVLAGAGAALAADRAAGEVSSLWAEGHKAKARLTAGDVDGRVMAFIEIELAPGWKTYWRNPGDAGGLPPSFDWSASKNLARANVHYPAPLRMSDKSGDTIGYKSGVVFPVELAYAAADQPLNLSLELQYGICKDVCVPVDMRLELDIPAGKLDSAGVAAQQALASVPRPQNEARGGDPKLDRAAASLEGETPRITIEGTFPGDITAAEVFLDAPDGTFVPHPKRVADLGGGRFVFEAALDPNSEVGDLRGKEITVTLVGAGGSSQALLDLK